MPDATTAPANGLDALIEDARRQLRICNACRYCEGYCDAFRAITRRRDFADGDVLQLANLCHDCRGCYHSCQYAPPHEFALNLPRALAEVRRGAWVRFTMPRRPAATLQRSAAAGLALAGGAVLAIGLLALALGPTGAPAFYGIISHGWMVAVFVPALLLPLALLALALGRYWRAVGGAGLRWRHLRHAADAALRLKNLTGGHGEGCNFERGERFSLARRRAHQLLMWGFLLCFAATAAGTVLHYGFDRPAPYPLVSLPKLFGLPGGVMLLAGALWMLEMRSRADPVPGDPAARPAGAVLLWLLAAIALTGLALFVARSLAPALVGPLTVAHLGTVLSFFLGLPFTKMAHAPFRLAALIRDAQETDTAGR